ncbi:nicotinate-nucleotide--dimethylbenzimidazole phosphoribosyltransferase [Streptomyces sp. NPDC096176]|uniref:nicotinate-nucleotide--dimethylbenzimidazole phosphoribosyltransferase n=1 Tax=Streptomyces sp. NPDC096176 TaxID=3366079 RepID=UPI00382682E6
MTDTGQIPGEGLPENAGMVEQPGVPAPGAYTYLEPSASSPEEDDLLLMPGAQGAWSDPQHAAMAPAGHMQAAPATDQYAAAPAGVQPMAPQDAALHQSGEYRTDYGSAAYQAHDYQAAPAVHGVEQGAGSPAPADAFAPGSAPDAVAAPEFVEVTPAAQESAFHVQAPPEDSQQFQDVQALPQDSQQFQVPAQEVAAQEPLVQVQGTMSVIPGVAPDDSAAVAVQAQAPAAAEAPAESSVETEASAEAAAAAVQAQGMPQHEAVAATQTAVHETGAHEAGGRDSGSVDLGAVRMPAAATSAMPTPPPARRPLHMGPPVPDTTSGVVRSLADRGPAGTPPHPMVVRTTPAQPAHTGVEYLDVPREEPAAELPGPQLGEIPPQAGAPWDPQPPQNHAPAAVPVAAEETVVPQASAEPAAEPTDEQPAAEATLEQAPVPAEATVPAPRTGGFESQQLAAAQEPAPAPEAASEHALPVAAEVPQSEPLADAVAEPVPVEVAPLQAPQAETSAAEAGNAAPSAPAPEAEPEPAPEAEPEPEAAPVPAAQAAPVTEPVAQPDPAPEQEPAPEAVAEPAPAEAAAEADTAPEAGPDAAAADAAPADVTPADAAPAPEAGEPAPGEDAVVSPVADVGEPAGEAPAPPPAESATAPAPGYDDAEREAVLRVMRERRDIRNGFRSDPIPHEVLLRVLEAAHTAPSVGHSQPWDFVVIRSAETRRTMHELAQRQREAYAKSLPKGRAKQFKELKIEAILDTPVNIVVTADPTRGGRHTLGRHTQPQMAPYSSALAVENLWLAARAEGLGVGWVSFFDEREMVRTLGLPEHLEVVAYLCVGYVDEFPEEPELMQAGWSKRRPLSWVVHEETYGRRALPGEEPHDLLQETVTNIRPLDAKALGEAWERQKRMTKPSGALGMLEIISAQLSGLSRMCPPPIPEPAAVAIFAGDHGVHAQGVTAWPQEVTGQMVANFLGGGAVCNAFANQVGAEVCVIDVGVASDLPATPGLLPRKVRAGTADFTTGPALSREEVLSAIEVGIETARDLVAAGNKALLTGEMGIANTTTSAALISVYTGADPSEITGRGTGINDEMHARKVDVVRRGLELHRPDPADPIGVLSAVGGLEHCALVGLILGGASLRTPVVLDGVSTGAAALVARAIAPEALAACIAGHRSAEPGHVAALNKLGLRPLVDLDLRLGEGTGALLALPVVQSAARAMHEVATFDSAGVTEK